jgi:hypothetical protein
MLKIVRDPNATLLLSLLTLGLIFAGCGQPGSMNEQALGGAVYAGQVQLVSRTSHTRCLASPATRASAFDQTRESGAGLMS